MENPMRTKMLKKCNKKLCIAKPKKYLYFFMFKMKNFERKIRKCCFISASASPPSPLAIHPKNVLLFRDNRISPKNLIFLLSSTVTSCSDISWELISRLSLQTRKKRKTWNGNHEDDERNHAQSSEHFFISPKNLAAGSLRCLEADETFHKIDIWNFSTA